MQALALVPGLIAALVALQRGPARAFLDVYLPALLLFPDYFRWIAPGLPDPKFNEAAILPVAAVFLLRHGARWRFSFADVLVIGFAFMTALTEYHAKDYAEAQNLMFDAICTIILPYVLAKGLIEPQGLRVAFAKRLVVLLTIVAFTMLYEAKMGRPLVRLFLDPFFPGQGSWVTTFRYGLVRAAGPYGHAILAGMVFLVGYRIQRWLQWSGAWQGRVPYLRINRGRFYTLAVFLGFALTLVRGPQLGALAGGAILMIARARNRRLLAGLVVAGVLVSAVPAYVAFDSYVSVGREGAQSVSQETAAYRKELVEKYSAIAMQRPFWGWGRGGWPTVPGLESTDNHYLLLALNHGVVTLGLFICLIAWNSVRLTRYGARRPRRDPSALLAFNLVGAYVGLFVALATVYQGMQAVQIFFLISGWADGMLLQRVPVAAPATAPGRLAPGPFAFRRVLA